jgi:integrase
MQDITYDVRVHAIEKRTNAAGKITSYRVLWKVDGQLFKEPFGKKAQADSFRSELVAATNKAQAFSTLTGRPVVWKQTINRMSWYDFACAYADMKWKDASAKHRADIARVLMLATPVLFTSKRGKPDDKAIRRALCRWGFNTKQRSEAPTDVAQILQWVARNTRNVDALADGELLRTMLDTVTTRGDGKRMAAVTTKKYRGILHNALEYAVVRSAIGENPLTGMKWIAVRASGEVDRRSVVNPAQGRALLEAVRTQQPSGSRLVALYGAMLYCGLRPEEAVEIFEHNLKLPAQRWNPAADAFEDPPEEEDWGELYVGPVAPEVARDWTDDGARRDSRPMPKHRAEGETRGPIPVPPVQVRLFREHLETFGVGNDGRIFRGVKSDVVPGETIRKVWGRARDKVLTQKEQNSPLAKRPYDLRHTCLSTWLNAGIPPRQIAEWAGHSLEILLRTYAKCMVGQDQTARRRIIEALR